MSFRLNLPEEVLGQRAVLESDTDSQAQEVHAVPLEEKRLDPVLEEAVVSQPVVEKPKEAPSDPQPEPEASKTPKPGPTSRPRLLVGGVLAAIGAGAILLMGMALGTKGGNGGKPSTSAGAAAGSPAGTGVNSGASTPELY
jgi:uncharacterized protein YcfJ